MPSRPAVLAAVAVLGAAQAMASDLDVSWYAITSSKVLSESKPEISDAANTLDLEGGWSCEIEATSKQLPAFEARSTVCTKPPESVEFSVQCSTAQPEDHVQLRFSSPSGRDYLELGCELVVRGAR